MNTLFQTQNHAAALDRSQQHRPTVVAYGCGGQGTFAAQVLAERLGRRVGFGWGLVDTSFPSTVAPHRALVLEPQNLPHRPTPSVRKWLELLDLPEAQYERLVPLVGSAGLSQIPKLGFLAAAQQFDVLKERLGRDFEAAAYERKGASVPWLVTISSAAGGTGAPSARVVGLAGRVAMGEALRWAHVLIATPLLSPTARTQRTAALEHQQLLEFGALMRPGMSLALPDVHQPVRKPGPDHLLVLSSSTEAPRTLGDCLDELATTLGNWLQ